MKLKNVRIGSDAVKSTAFTPAQIKAAWARANSIEASPAQRTGAAHPATKAERVETALQSKAPYVSGNKLYYYLGGEPQVMELRDAAEANDILQWFEKARTGGSTTFAPPIRRMLPAGAKSKQAGKLSEKVFANAMKLERRRGEVAAFEFDAMQKKPDMTVDELAKALEKEFHLNDRTIAQGEAERAMRVLSTYKFEQKRLEEIEPKLQAAAEEAARLHAEAVAASSKDAIQVKGGTYVLFYPGRAQPYEVGLPDVKNSPYKYFDNEAQARAFSDEIDRKLARARREGKFAIVLPDWTIKTFATQAEAIASVEGSQPKHRVGGHGTGRLRIQVDEARLSKMWKEGVPRGKIAEELGISEASVNKIRKQLGLKPRSGK